MIDTQSIRTKILDLAIRGKLTEQRPEDGTAEELYQQIQAEKLSLIKAGKIKKEKSLPEITDDEIPFEIPDNWKWVRLGKFGSWHAGATPSRGNSAYYNGSIPWLKTGDLNDNYITSVPEAITELALKECSVQLNPIGSVLIAMYGATIGKLGIAEIPLTTNQACCACVPYNGIYNRYLFILLMAMRKTFINMGIGGAQSNISKEKIVNAIVPLPPLAEQKRIVEKIEQTFSVLDTIDTLQAQYANNLTVLKSKLIDLAIQGKLTEQLSEDGTAEELYQQIQAEKTDIIITHKGRKDNNILPIDEDVPFDVPNNWKWIRFGETGFFRKGPFGSSLTKSMFVPKSENTVKIYEQQHAINKDHTLGTYYITREYFDTSMKGFEVVPGDIIVSCAGTIGETYIMPETIECGIINQALMRITVVPSIDKRFFLYYFDSQLKSRAKDGNGMAITNIPPFDVLKNLYFPLPPLAEQKRIVDRLDKLLAVCDEMR